MTPELAYEITRAAVQKVSLARTVRPETQVYGPEADMDSLDMVGAIVDIEREVDMQGQTISIAVGDMVGTVTVKDLAQYVYELCQ